MIKEEEVLRRVRLGRAVWRISEERAERDDGGGIRRWLCVELRYDDDDHARWLRIPAALLEELAADARAVFDRHQEEKRERRGADAQDE